MRSPQSPEEAEEPETGKEKWMEGRDRKSSMRDGRATEAERGEK